MRDGWADWFIGTTLAIWAGMTPLAMYAASRNSGPSFPWTFFAFYGAIAVVVAIGAAIFLRRGWSALHWTPPA
jgi:hypothetical protein